MFQLFPSQVSSSVFGSNRGISFPRNVPVCAPGGGSVLAGDAGGGAVTGGGGPNGASGTCAINDPASPQPAQNNQRIAFRFRFSEFDIRGSIYIRSNFLYILRREDAFVTDLNFEIKTLPALEIEMIEGGWHKARQHIGANF